MPHKLAIIVTHPIQYYSPLFKALAEDGRITIKVFYTWGESALKDKFDTGFGKVVDWDIPLFDGYDYEFLENTSHDPGSHKFAGIDNPSLIKSIKSWKPDSVLIAGWSYKSHLIAMRYFKGKIPVYFRGDSTLLGEKPGIKKSLRRLFLRWVYSYADYAFYAGTRNKEYFLAHGLKEKQLIFAPHSVENERFEDISGEYNKKALQWRSELGIKEDEIAFLFAGKFQKVKQPVMLLEAFIKLVRSGGLNNPKAHLILVGSGELEEQLRKNSYNHTSIHPYIHILPFQNQSLMPVVYRLGDVYMLTSKSETWGLAVNEAMSCGKPVIVSDKVGCAVDLVKEGVNGYIFEHNNKEDLVNKMMLLTSLSKEELKSFGENSKKIIDKWRVKDTVEGIIKALTIEDK
jgi:glycosyltransferase involved in cell wall biosynthesis